MMMTCNLLITFIDHNWFQQQNNTYNINIKFMPIHQSPRIADCLLVGSSTMWNHSDKMRPMLADLTREHWSHPVIEITIFNANAACSIMWNHSGIMLQTLADPELESICSIKQLGSQFKSSADILQSMMSTWCWWNHSSKMLRMLADLTREHL